MESIAIIEVLATAAVTIAAAALLGFLIHQLMGLVILAAASGLACGIPVAGWALGFQLAGVRGAWIGLLVGIALGGLAGAGLLGKMIRGKGFRTLLIAAYVYGALCIFGHLAGGWLGLLTVSLPAIVILFAGLYRVAPRVLPLADGSQRRQAFRSLLTFTLGTNYPYYVVHEGKLDKRVDGNAYGQFLAGPGIVLARCDQVAYRTDGIHVLPLAEPGLTFTGKFELPPKVVDLRTQVSALRVEALTSDGIQVQAQVFVPFQIARGGQNPELGQAFPFRRAAVYEAVVREPVEPGLGGQDDGGQPWRAGLIPPVARRALQDILSRYSLDELCAAKNPGGIPRDEIMEALGARVREEMKSYGVEILGAGIDNLKAVDDSIAKRRIDNWRTEWVRQVWRELSEGDAERMREIEKARAEAEIEVVLKLGKVVEASLASGDSETALTLRFIDCLGEMVSESDSRWPVPSGLEKTIQQLTGKIPADDHHRLADKG
jgi:regulator of protease activity HflC (stomatin/prohibitin superfamily)